MKKILAAGVGAGALIALGAVAPVNAADSPAMLSVLHGVPGLTVDVYVNDELTLDDFEPGELAGPLELPAGTYTVAITAADAAVDVPAGGSAVVSNLTNPNEQKLDTTAGVVSATIVAAGTTEPAVLGPADVDVAEGVNTIVYAWGSLEDGNLALANQTVTGMHSSPDGVPAGSAGLAATNAPGNEAGTWAVIGGAILAALALGFTVLRRRGTAGAER